jgi:uncharacterized integral membrane protein
LNTVPGGPLRLDPEEKSMSVKLIACLLLAALGLVFVAQNTAVVEIRFLFWHAAMSRALLMLFWLLTGFVLGWLARGVAAGRRARRGA